MAGPEALQARRVQVLECLEFVVAWSRDPLQERVRLPPAVIALKADVVAADLAHQLSQQGQQHPFALRQIGAVLADDPSQRAQVPFAGRHRSCHDTPPSKVLRSRRPSYPQNVGWQQRHGPATLVSEGGSLSRKVTANLIRGYLCSACSPRQTRLARVDLRSVGLGRRTPEAPAGLIQRCAGPVQSDAPAATEGEDAMNVLRGARVPRGAHRPGADPRRAAGRGHARTLRWRSSGPGPVGRSQRRRPGRPTGAQAEP